METELYYRNLSSTVSDFELNKDHEMIITDPETDRTVIVSVKKVGQFMNIAPESIMQSLINYYNEIENDFNLSSNNICKKGCNDCCTNDFEISITEYFMILNYIGIKYGPEQIRRYSEKARSSVSLSQCIFVDCTNGACSIYEVRPLICRKYGLYNCISNCSKLNENEDLLSSYTDTSENTLTFKHPIFQKRVMCPPKRIVHWFGNLKNGKLATEKMERLFYASFNLSSDEFVKNLFL